ncbi:hypothetical protein V5O48_018035, partial [Marasmius crinis-equi]
MGSTKAMMMDIMKSRSIRPLRVELRVTPNGMYGVFDPLSLWVLTTHMQDLRGVCHWMEAQGLAAEDDERQVVKRQILQVPFKPTPSIRSFTSAGRTSSIQVIAGKCDFILGQ